MAIRWIAHVWKDSPMDGKQLLLHLALADFANDEGECWPSIKTLAKKSRSSAQWVRRGLRELEEAGLLEVFERGVGRGNANRYRLLPTQKGASELPDSSTRKGQVSDQNGASELPERGKSLSPLYRTVREPSRIEATFETFWQSYPRKIGKGAARRAFERVMDRDDAPSLDVLVAAVERYAKTITEMRFVAHAATWLNGERWLDEIADDKSATVEKYPPHIFAAIAHVSPFVAAGYPIEQMIEQMPDDFTDEQRQIAIDNYNERRPTR